MVSNVVADTLGPNDNKFSIGKHDVGSLKNRTGKSRFGSHGHSHGHHSHHGTTSSRA